MAKYSYELKLKIVEDYMNGKGGYNFLAGKYGIADHSTVRKWVTSYKTLGKDSLKRSRQNKSYSVQFKLDAVELYLTTEMSYRELANELELNDPTRLASWVRTIHSDGIDGLSKPKGRPSKMTHDKNRQNPDKVKPKGLVEPDVKALEKRIRHLEIENAFLKELRRLRSEESQKTTNKSQESSTSSEDDLN